MKRVNLSYVIEGQELDFKTENSVYLNDADRYLYASNKAYVSPYTSSELTFTSSNPNIVDVNFKYGMWMTTYKGIGIADITATWGSYSRTQQVTVNRKNIEGNSIEVGTGSGNLTIDGTTLVGGDTVIIKGGTYSTISISDILISDGEFVTIMCDGVVNVNRINLTDLRNVLLDGSRVNGEKYGFQFNDVSTAFQIRRINRTEIRNVKIENCSAYSFEFPNIYDLKYDGTESSYMKDNTFRHISLNKSSRFMAGGWDGHIDMTRTTGKIPGLCVNWKFIDWEITDCNSGAMIEVGTGQDILFDGITMDHVNVVPLNHNGLFFVRGHAIVRNCRVSNFQGNIIRLWPFAINDGHINNAGKKALFYNNVGFKSRTYGGFEVQSQSIYMLAGQTTFVDIDIFNNTLGYQNLSTPQFFVGTLCDNYNLEGGTLRMYNNVVIKPKVTGTNPFFGYGNNPSPITTGQHQEWNNKWYNSYEEAGINPINFLLTPNSIIKNITPESTQQTVEKDVYGNLYRNFIGAVQVNQFSIMSSTPPTKPVLRETSTTFNSVTYPMVVGERSQSEVGIKKYVAELNGVIDETLTEGGQCRVGMKNASATNPFTPDNVYYIRIKAVDWLDQESPWSDRYTLSTYPGGIIPNTLNFTTPTEVTTYETKKYLFGVSDNKLDPIIFSSSDETKAKVYLKNSVWHLDYLGVGTVDIIATQGEHTFTKTVTVSAPPSGRIVNVGTGSGNLTISRTANGLLDGDTVVIQGGNYEDIRIEDIMVEDGNPPIEIITDGLVSAQGDSSSLHFINLKNVIIDGSRVDGIKYGLEHRDNFNQSTLSLKNVNDCEFRNIATKNLWSPWGYGGMTDVFYDGTEGSYAKNVTMINILCDNTGGGLRTGGEIRFDREYPINNLLVNFKFIGWEMENLSPGYSFYIGAGQDILFDQFTINHMNGNSNTHNGLFFVRGHANVSNSLITNHQGNTIRLWPFSIVDGILGSEIKTAHFYNNVVFRSRVYSAFEIQGFSSYYQEGYSRGVHLAVYNNTAGHLALADPLYFIGKLVDRYSNGEGGLFYAYNNILAKSVGDGGNMFQYYATTEQTLIENRLYADYQEAKFNPANFTLDETSTAWGTGVLNEYTQNITHDVYGNLVTGDLSMGAVQVGQYVLPVEDIEPPTKPDITTGNHFPPGNGYHIDKENMIFDMSVSESEVGIDNYDIEVNGVIYNTVAGYPRIGKQANYTDPNTPFTEDGKAYTMRVRARDFLGQTSEWTDYFMMRTGSKAVDTYTSLTPIKTSGGTLTYENGIYTASDSTVYAKLGVIPSGKGGRLTCTHRIDQGILGWAKTEEITDKSEIVAGLTTTNSDTILYYIEDGVSYYNKDYGLACIYFHYNGGVIIQKSYDAGVSWTRSTDQLSDTYMGDKYIVLRLEPGESVEDPRLFIFEGQYPTP